MTMNANNGVIRTKMAEALISAVVNGRKTGRIGRVILTKMAEGKGVKYDPARAVKRKQAKADSAVMMKGVV
jgi:hypothetical protein